MVKCTFRNMVDIVRRSEEDSAILTPILLGAAH